MGVGGRVVKKTLPNLNGDTKRFWSRRRKPLLPGSGGLVWLVDETSIELCWTSHAQIAQSLHGENGHISKLDRLALPESRLDQVISRYDSFLRERTNDDLTCSDGSAIFFVMHSSPCFFAQRLQLGSGFTHRCCQHSCAFISQDSLAGLCQLMQRAHTDSYHLLTHIAANVPVL